MNENVTPLDIETGADGVVTIWLDQPDRSVLVLSRALIRRLEATLDGIPKTVPGLVLASTHERVFVAGADLVEIDGLTDSELDEYLTTGQEVFGRIAEMKCRTVAAITGAALGGGLEIAMHCDELVAMKPATDDRPYPVGLPEASLSLCPGWGGANMLPARIDPRTAIERTATGKPFTFHEAAEAGLFSATAAGRDETIALARSRAAEPKPERRGEGPPNLSHHPEPVKKALESAVVPETKAAKGVINCIEAGLRDGWAAGLKAEKDTLIGLRSTNEARAALESFFAKQS